MRLLLTFFFIIFMFQSFSFSQEWIIKNKWKISCGLVNKEALIINGKPKKTYTKNEFKVDSAIFKLNKGDIGKCKSDKKPTGGYKYSGRQEITHKLFPGKNIFEAEILTAGAPQYRSHFFQIHDGRSKGKPPSMVSVNKDWMIRNQHSIDCFKPNCKQLSYCLLYTSPSPRDG